ncbi:GerMN domain-containing protein [Granulicella sp. dw_53]|uniref:GerMN domain-containing protein n=1 Tax=Granulicella sp. dw_53 TaxID=2719792 RepID=UPI001BD31406|nr:GerMN domain-containing protein [Granulicella sp. dw_53]
MIPRYQRILFWTLIAGILLMTLFLLRGCEQAHKRLTAVDDATPISAPTNAETEEMTLYLANDADGSITTATRQLALPQEPTVRARTLLKYLLANYALPASAHPLQGGPAVDDVFLMALPGVSPSEFSPATAQLAIVNLHGAFVANHPSGIGVEDLTIQSITGTLHTAFPELTQIRFLVDGQPHDTLAGHADLQRTYSAIDTSYKPGPLAVEGANRR